MDNNLNKNSLKKAITRLPNYEPPEAIWMAIDSELNLKEGIEALPQYTPTNELWENINQQLPTKKTKLFSLKKWAIAATILLGVGINFWFYQQSPTTSLSYALETIDPQLLQADWDEDEQLFDEISAICQMKTYSCTVPEFQLLETELEELNEAKSDLKQAIHSFGKDTDLINQLSKIELERTAVLKKMIATIL